MPPGCYELVAGHHRFRIAQELGWFFRKHRWKMLERSRFIQTCGAAKNFPRSKSTTALGGESGKPVSHRNKSLLKLCAHLST
jgi:hypothetical protein